jgi:hypothetical protein
MQGLTAAPRETQGDKTKTAREPGDPQVADRFRRWWQVQGSNLRRLSRRFYRPSDLIWLRALDLWLCDRLPADVVTTARFLDPTGWTSIAAQC